MALTDEDIISNLHTDFERAMASQTLNSEINTYTTTSRNDCYLSH